MIGHFDLDVIKHGAACAGEKRSVKVIHKKTGRSIIVPTRTDWYGSWQKKEGGQLSEINKIKGTNFTWDDFEYEDIQEQDPIENILHTAKLMVEKAVSASGASSVKYYIGKGDSMRVERSTLLKYKDNRTSMLKALALDEVTEYLIKKFKAEVVTHEEVDDRVVMNTYGKKNHFIIGVDKDYYGSGSKFFNMNKPEKGIVDTNCFGELTLNEKKEVEGYGRIFKMYQICSSDQSDNYAANCVSDMKWGSKSAYKALVDCKTDKELFEAAVGVFQTLYPSPRVVLGWRGDDIEVDWLYVFQECFDMAHLHRKENDWVNVLDVLKKLEINYG